MKKYLLPVAALIALGSAIPAQANGVLDFGVIPIDGTPAVISGGPTLGTSTGFYLGGASDIVNQLGADDTSGLALGDTVGLTQSLSYTIGATDATQVFKTWTVDAGAYTETLTSIFASSTGADNLELLLTGTISGPGFDPNSPAFFLVTVNQVASGAINWSGTESSINPLGTPLPAAMPLFATGLGALGLLGWRRKRKNAAAVAA